MNILNKNSDENFVIDQVSPSTLAFIGDSVFGLLINSILVRKFSNFPVSYLNKIKNKLVCCKAQHEFYNKILNKLNEKEKSICLRGRNTKTKNRPKNAKIIDYRCATGIEALFGYLYLHKNFARIEELLSYFNENFVF